MKLKESIMFCDKIFFGDQVPAIFIIFVALAWLKLIIFFFCFSETVEMGKRHSDFVVGFVCQSPHVVQEPYFLQLTPGVKLEDGTDSLGQNYNTPEHAVLVKGADIAVVGRGIILNPNPGKWAKIFKERLWAAYCQRVGRLTSDV